MYLPDSFREASLPRLHRFIDQHSFATIITPSPEGLHCSHVPVLLQPQADSPGVLQGHFARANPHSCVKANGPTLCVFQGPHAYISPNWVSDRNVVPTWNYVAVHARGQLVLQHDPEWLHTLFIRMAQKYEAALPDQWSLSSPDPSYLERMTKGTIGFEIAIEQLDGKWKLSQNHPVERRLGIIAGLRSIGSTTAEQVADLMLANCHSE